MRVPYNFAIASIALVFLCSNPSLAQRRDRPEKPSTAGESASPPERMRPASAETRTFTPPANRSESPKPHSGTRPAPAETRTFTPPPNRSDSPKPHSGTRPAPAETRTFTPPANRSESPKPHSGTRSAPSESRTFNRPDNARPFSGERSAPPRSSTFSRPPEIRQPHRHVSPPLPPPRISPHVSVSIHSNFVGFNTFWSPFWFSSHSHAWRPVVVVSPNFWWGHSHWEDVCAFHRHPVSHNTTVIVAAPAPSPYNYGDNVVYKDGLVFVNGVPYVSAEQYYDLARNISAKGDPSKAAVEELNQDWIPLGTFAVVKNANQKESETIIQLAVNKDGVVRGNEVDQKTDSVSEIVGAVDQETQRVAFHVKGSSDYVAECGLWNLTQETVPLLLHFGTEKTETRTLLRLNNPEANAKP